LLLLNAEYVKYVKQGIKAGTAVKKIRGHQSILVEINVLCVGFKLKTITIFENNCPLHMVKYLTINENWCIFPMDDESVFYYIHI
jgi:hypothetical protein